MTEAFDIVIFGGAGDLAYRKLLPALYRTVAEGKLPTGSRLIACCRNPADVAGYHDRADVALREHLAEGEYKDDCAAQFQQHLMPFELNITEPNQHWQEMAELLDSEAERVRVYYLAIPPTLFGECCKNLNAFKLIHGNSRVVVEKPLGYDAASAHAINEEIARYFDESAIYRIDHYLGKETVQNLMALRFTLSLIHI